ncbi:hypothetical protein RA210_U50163 [Rubrivivax sp. A210]|uniref:hypothetical protein n=1 Tax=Rubrivivax sp. A210 TaxID=2772301 RepID=UPI0019180CEE|nr:hypothetical protein [Rubrivivax sp. A210]CAD5374212.1 hypothetical protein RA210_U50163 [Rubrivivax sp. A210]
MNADECLAWVAAQTVMHEFVRCEVLAMTGATEAQVTIAGNVHAVLRPHLRGWPRWNWN